MFSGLSQDFVRPFLQLFQEFLKTFSGLDSLTASQDFTRNFQGLSQAFPGLFHGSLRTFLRLYQDLFITYSKLSHNFLRTFTVWHGFIWHYFFLVIPSTVTSMPVHSNAFFFLNLTLAFIRGGGLSGGYRALFRFELPACYHPNLDIFWGVWLFQNFFLPKKNPTQGESLFENSMENPFFDFLKY